MRQGSLIIFILVSAVLFWGGVVCFVSCSGKPENRAVEVAEKALMASVDNPKSVKILAISKADSVFGRDYVTMDEKMALSMAKFRRAAARAARPSPSPAARSALIRAQRSRTTGQTTSSSALAARALIPTRFLQNPV